MSRSNSQISRMLASAIDEFVANGPRSSAILSFVEAVEEGRVSPPPGEAGGDTRPSGCSWSPCGITGDKVTKGIDWINGTLPISSMPRVELLVSKYLGAAVKLARGKNTYQSAMQWESGALLCWTEGRPEAWLSLNGDSLALVPVEDHLIFLSLLAGSAFKCTRLDTRVDVPRTAIRMDLIHAAAVAGNVRGFRRYDPRRPVKSLGSGDLEGDGAYFGRRGRDGSGRFYRVYDKFLETKGVIDATRFEVELSQEIGQCAFESLVCCDSRENFECKIGELTCGAIDFVDKSGAHRHADRMERLPWWAWLVSIVGEARISVPRVIPPLQSTLEYLRDAFCTSTALLYEMADSVGEDGEAAVLEFARLMVGMGKRNLARPEVAGRMGARRLGLDFDRLLHRSPI